MSTAAETYRIVKARVYRDMANEIFRHLHRSHYQEVVNSINVIGKSFRECEFSRNDKVTVSSVFMRYINIQKFLVDSSEEYWELVKHVPRPFRCLNIESLPWTVSSRICL
jgi:hypothetical protein